MSVPRNIKKFFSEETLMIDLGQSWKLFDNKKDFNTVILYNGAICIGGSSRKRTSQRITWIETDKGPYLLDSDSDYNEAARITGITVLQMRDIIAKSHFKPVVEVSRTLALGVQLDDSSK